MTVVKKSISACFCALLMANSPPSTAQADVTSNGRFMVDGSGRTLMIHGVNQVNKQPPFDHISLGFDESHAAFLKDYGFNGIRLGILWAGVEPTRGQYDLEYLESIRQTVRMLDFHGFHVLLDLHQDAFSTKNGGSGYPEWAALGGGNPSKLPFPLMYFDTEDNAVAQDFDAFWRNADGVQDSYMDMLELVVATLGDEDGVLGIEFMNEPFPGTSWTDCGSFTSGQVPPWDFSEGCVEFDSTTLTDFYKRAAARVRAVNQDIMVAYDELGIGGIGAPGHIGDIEDDNKVFSWHNYNSYDYASIFENAEDHQKSSGAAMLMTEFGASTDTDSFAEVLTLADSHLMSWMFWTYSNNPPYPISGDGLLPPEGELQGLVYDLSQPMNAQNLSKDRAVNLDLERVEFLSRPYPQLTAGIPQSLEYDDATGVLKYRWTIEGYTGDSPHTQIYLPEHRFPNGYEVEARNSVVISGPPNASLLVLKNEGADGARSGEVVVTPIGEK
ncbi:cellulase family glycosylhydrolase [Thalassorhabdomicrobium marinisediminis]|uniref:cellulase family glycosylhydrolase n=1 Tax=Thalassorhabdomicrobium marinisediminis TaxID=2170577 RepID=UPI0024917D4F|nr:cellulase family glycosylhydrolase [Thalassorhabdomicrobium marinisediminis]